LCRDWDGFKGLILTQKSKTPSRKVLAEYFPAQQ